MNLYQAHDEWENLTDSHKFEVLTNLCRAIVWRADPESDAVYDFLLNYVELESGGFFGPEGLLV